MSGYDAAQGYDAPIGYDASSGGGEPQLPPTVPRILKLPTGVVRLPTEGE